MFQFVAVDYRLWTIYELFQIYIQASAYLGADNQLYYERKITGKPNNRKD